MTLVVRDTFHTSRIIARTLSLGWHICDVCGELRWCESRYGSVLTREGRRGQMAALCLRCDRAPPATFWLDQRVKLSRYGEAYGVSCFSNTGTVVGFGRRGGIRVKRDGLVTVNNYSPTFWEAV